MKNITICLIYILSIIPISMLSQTYNITGRVLDQQKKAVNYAEIILSTTDSLPLQSQLCQEDGTFILNNLNASTYLIQIKTLGKIHFSQIINLSKNIYIGDIIVEPSIELQEVTVFATKKIFEHKIDRLVFNVGNSMVTTASNALDVLAITPNVRVLNNQILLIGRNSLKVMINDKIISLADDDLVSYLNNIKSEQIDKIEVITNPPSKYDAEGNSGLINIKLKNAQKNSFNGTLKSTLSQANKSIGDIGLNLNFQKDKLSITGNLSYMNGISQPEQTFIIYYPNKLWNEFNKRDYHYNDYTSLFTINYQVSPQISMGASYNYSVASPISKYVNKASVYNELNNLDSLIINNSKNTINRKTHDITIYSEFIFDKKGSKLNVDMNYLNYNFSNNNDFFGNAFRQNQQFIDNSSYYARNNGNLNITIYNIKTDFTFPFEWCNVNLGAKLNFMKNNSFVGYYNMSSGISAINNFQTDYYSYKENIQSIYLSCSKKISKKLELQIGIRGEWLQSNGYSHSSNKSYSNDYIKLFTTFYANYSLTDEQVFSVNYNKRINRPPYSLLNPFRYYSNAYNYSEGNPFLKPYFTDNFSLSYMYKNYYASLYFNQINDKYDKITYVNKNSTTQMVKPYNFYNIIGGGVYQEITFNLNKRWESTNGLSIYCNKVKSKEPSIVPNIDSWSSSLSTNNTFTIDKNKRFYLFVNFLYQSPSTAGSYKLSDYCQLDCGFKASLFDNKLSLSISGSDILKTNKMTFSQQVNGIQQKSYDYGDTRRFKISVMYSFGKTFQLNKRRAINSEEIKRL